MKPALYRLVALSGLIILSALSLSACADNHTQDNLYHPHKHHGQRTPGWYKPPGDMQPSR
ncbi:hypothetical protein [Acetobacter cibinongensis]|nr:hypothetical protein [Acetobacter cibinongensis]